jgi:iduronate 2-sulfatase
VIKKLFFTAVVCGLFTAFSSARAQVPQAQSPDAKKLNVLLIISDDLCADLGCYGAPVKSPNVDALAKRGVRLDRAYCQFPLCGPSRCSFLSGLQPDTEGVLANGLPVRHKIKDLVTLPELFRKNGYRSMRVGKIYHLGIPGQVGTPGPDDPPSWDSTFNPKGNEFPSLDDGDQFDPNPKNGQSFRRNLLNGDGHDQADYQSASEAIRLLDENKERPFFLAVGFIRPHVPEVAPRKFFDLYDINQIHVPERPEGDRAGKPPLAFSHPPDINMSQQDCIESIRAYHATTSWMDAQAGRVIDELHRLNLDDKTLIIFMSDHGYLLGQHQEWQKMTLFEETCRVPMIFVVPGTKHAGETARGMVESLDLYPTVAQVCGLTPPKQIEGKSFVGLLDDPAGAGRDAAFTQLLRKQTPGHSIRTDRYRYTEWDHGKQGAELYDQNDDPHEFKNLAKDPEHAQIIAELRQQLHEHYKNSSAPRGPAGAERSGE